MTSDIIIPQVGMLLPGRAARKTWLGIEHEASDFRGSQLSQFPAVRLGLLLIMRFRRLYRLIAGLELIARCRDTRASRRLRTGQNIKK
jgi:hypothetical protein